MAGTRENKSTINRENLIMSETPRFPFFMRNILPRSNPLLYLFPFTGNKILKTSDDWLPWFTEEQRLYGDPAKCLTICQLRNSGESEKNIYAEIYQL